MGVATLGAATEGGWRVDDRSGLSEILPTGLHIGPSPTTWGNFIFCHGGEGGREEGGEGG